MDYDLATSSSQMSCEHRIDREGKGLEMTAITVEEI